ncbi:MAG: winged helix-turn-helix domain-containing protein [Chthoniobacteraceae bacterium]
MRFEGGGATASLISIAQRKAGEPVSFKDEASGVALTTPPDWLVHLRKRDGDSGPTIIYLLDPEAESEGGALKLLPIDSLSEARRKSPRAWADDDLTNDFKDEFKALKVREDSWKNLTVAGHPAVSFVADYDEKGKAHVLFVTCTIGPKSGGQFMLRCDAEKFRAVKMAFDTISHRLTKRGVEVPLASKEFRMLEFFLQRPGRALTRENILNAVWGNSFMVTTRSVDRCVTTLRGKIEPDTHRPTFIHTIREIGYRFEEQEWRTR